MARSMLHSPFAQQHPHSSSSRVSPFQRSATAGSLHGLELDDIEASWVGSEYGRRQRFLDVFEPMGSAARSSSVQHRDQDQQVNLGCLAIIMVAAERSSDEDMLLCLQFCLCHVLYVWLCCIDPSQCSAHAHVAFSMLLHLITAPQLYLHCCSSLTMCHTSTTVTSCNTLTLCHTYVCMSTLLLLHCSVKAG
jgi:hypothetical protein